MRDEAKIALGIPHTPWRPERVESLRRLRYGLDLTIYDDGIAAPRNVIAKLFAERAANHVWSESMWKWGAESSATHFLTLQDDVIPAPGFWPALRAMLEAVPDQVIGLEVVHPATRALAEEGHRWFTTSDCVIGVGYVMPRGLLVEFLEWRATKLKPGALEAITEDTLVGLWCLATARKIWHPIPTLIDHDTSLASTYRNDAHENRRPLVRWDSYPPDAIASAKEWRNRVRDARGPAAAPHLGRFYEATAGLALQWVDGFDHAAFTRARTDEGAAVKRALALRIRARTADQPRPRVLLCTPTRGVGAAQYTTMLMRLAGGADAELVDPYDIDAQLWTEDVVRTRSRFVRACLETDCSHLWFVDDDISSDAPVRLLTGMLRADRDIVCAPYPRRDGIDWARVRKVAELPAEAAAYYYPLKLVDPTRIAPDAGECIEIEGMGLGCALIKRAALERMVDFYDAQLPSPADAALSFLAADPAAAHDDLAETIARAIEADRELRDRCLGFDCVEQGQLVPTVALFQLLLRDRVLHSEDYSFCNRWRDMGGKIHLYLGPGSPVHHHGSHVYRGAIEAFHLRRIR